MAPCDAQALIADLADRSQSAAKWSSLAVERAQAIVQRDGVIAELQHELAEPRKPVGVEPNPLVERVRQEWIDSAEHLAECQSAGFEIDVDDAHFAVVTLLSAYDALAQDCARYVNGHHAMLAEMRGLRERKDNLHEQLAAWRVHFSASEERERRLREALVCAHNHLEMPALLISPCNDHEKISAALAQPQACTKCGADSGWHNPSTGECLAQPQGEQPRRTHCAMVCIDGIKPAACETYPGCSCGVLDRNRQESGNG